MSVNTELYDALAALLPEGCVFDTRVPDDFNLDSVGGRMIVFQEISDVPGVAIDDEILSREQRWQVSIRCTDLTAARTLKAAVIAALHGLRGEAIQHCSFESCPGVIPELDGVPQCYHYPVDFTVLS